MTTAATCTGTGVRTYTCTLCGATKTETIASLGHSWDSGKVTKEPTATQTGVRTYTCTRCGTTKTETIPATGGGSADQFYDIRGHWAFSAIVYVVEHNLFNGTSSKSFEPETAMTRAMLVTVLWRYEGSPKGYSCDFRDVKSGDWFAAAVAWASAKGVVNGVENGRFDPNGNITREQLAAILYRYSSKKGLNTSARADFGRFPDGGRVGSWAKDAMRWAVAENLISGDSINGRAYINPQGEATRAQVATILMRFIENVAN